jgi:hypothetical protein
LHDLSDAIGRLVQVTYGGGPMGCILGQQVQYGRLEAVEDGLLFIRRADGETIFVPVELVDDWRIVEVPELDPARMLLRPAGPGESDPATLLRPADPPDG